MNQPLSPQHNASLKNYNTFGIDAMASSVLRISSLDQLPELHAQFTAEPERNFVFLGGGSNVILPDHINALVLHIDLKGKQVVARDQNTVMVSAAAGENWHEFVQWTIAQGLGGLENLSLIPGTVGAAPIQNIGAYGRELKDCFHSLRAFDLLSGQERVFTKEQCAFAYRDSIFKLPTSRHLLITEVCFQFSFEWKPELSYGDVAQRLREQGLLDPTPQQVSDTICAIRRSKLPDPREIGNAGSFFKNPIVSMDLRDRILAEYPHCVSYPLSNGQCKLAAGWLIEQAGWKGRQIGNVGVYAKQALVLVNHGGATGREVRAFAEAIQDDVAKKFGVHLEVEPIFVD